MASNWDPSQGPDSTHPVSQTASERGVKNQTTDPLPSENDFLHDPIRTMEGTTGSAQHKATYQEISGPPEDSAAKRVSHSFCVLLEVENVKEIQLRIQEKGCNTSGNRKTFKMTQSKVTVPLSKKTWWKAKIDIQLPEKTKYTYTYMFVKEASFKSPSSFIKQPTKERCERTMDSMVHNDLFNYTNLLPKQTIICLTHYELELCRLVNNGNITRYLFDDDTKKLHSLLRDAQNEKFLQDVQSHILNLIGGEGNSDAQVIFLASLLGIFTIDTLPSLEKVATSILTAFRNCKAVIRPSLEKQQNKDTSYCLMEIIRSSIQALKQSWLQLVFYTYPVVNATKLCSWHDSWPCVSQTDDKLAVNEEDVLSVCFKHYECKDSEMLLISLVFQSITDVKLLLKVLNKSEHAQNFQDDHGYKSWVKDALQKRMQSMKPEDIQNIWEEVAETDFRILHLLGKELVLGSLSHSKEWSNNANKFMRSLLSDEGFWTTYQDHQLSDSLLKVLHKMLEQKDTQEGIDLNLKVISMQWITKWLSLEELERLCGTMFKKQLHSTMPLAKVVHFIYMFLSTVHSIRWFDELSAFVEQLGIETLKFIIDRKQQDTLLEIVFSSPQSAHVTLPDSGMKLAVKHLILSIQSTQMNTSLICELLKPYAPNGIIDLHSRNAVDVLLSLVETKFGAKDDVFTILESSSFWQLIFKAEGQMVSELHNNQVYRAVVTSLSCIEQNLLHKKVTVGFINKLERSGFCGNLEQLCKIANTGADFVENKDQTFREPLETLQTHKQILHQLETFSFFCSKFRMILSGKDLKIMRKELSLRMQHVDAESQTCLMTLVDLEYWGFLKPFLETAKDTSKFSNSTVFFNICISFVKNIHTAELSSAPCTADDSSSDNDLEKDLVSDAEAKDQLKDEPELKSLKIDDFSKLVSSKCLPLYNKLRSDIAEGCKTMIVRNMKIMFAGVIKVEVLHRELEIMQIHAKQSFDYLKSWISLKDLMGYSKQLQCLFKTFEVPEQKAGDLLDNVELLVNIFDPDNDGKTLREVHMAVKSIEDVEKKFNDEDWCRMHELIHSKDLIQFLRPIIDDDLRNLTDAVEERSDSLINESTVSDLIEVQRYLRSFLRIEVMDTPEKLINSIAKSKQLEMKNVSEKIRTCNEHFHALRNLYNNIAQRGEMTKKIIRNALEKGSYKFVLKNDGEMCKVSMSYTRNDGTSATYEQDELNDLRSRALLMVNSRISCQPEGSEGDRVVGQMFKYLQKFIQCIDEVSEIVALCSRLSNSGHYHFRRFQDSVRDLESLLSLKDRLEREDSNWRSILKDARGQFYFLNFFHARHLWLLDQFFRGEIDSKREVVHLFHYVNPDIHVGNNLRTYYESPDDTNDLRMRVFQIGEALQEVFSGVVTPVREIVCLKPHQKATVESIVQRGTVFVAELDPESTNSIPVLMTLLKNTTGKYPLANHVLFCHLETTWEEVYLLLQRCRKASSMPQHDLYVLINVEQLTTEIQFMLVDEVRGIQEEERSFLLAIICRGGCHHHIIDQFSPHYTHRIQGMTPNEMRDCLEQGWPDIEVVTSEVPGLGKSEYISCRASEKGKSCHLLPMGGPQTKIDLVRQLLQTPPSEFQLLHIDIRTTSNPSLIDSFIFELIVVGMVVAGSFLCKLNMSDILIEIANVQQNNLRNSLTNCCKFKRHHIEWDNYNSFLVSEEVNSPDQVVCSYLKAVNERSLDAKQITFSSSSKGSLLPQDKCRHLLRTHFFPTSKMAFTTVNMFLNVLATELKKLSASHYFTEDALRAMLGKDVHCVRSDLFKALDAVAQEFSSRSVEAGGTQSMTGRDAAEALNELHLGPSVTAKKMVARVKGMVQWADSNHLMVVFNQQDTQTLSTLYRLLSQVPKSVKKLFEQQLAKKLPDYQRMSQKQLQSVLEKICRNTRDPFARSKLGHLDKGYALTPDNLMKMVLVHMRIKSRIPVVIMGETGCGKTTLITYLARVCEVPFYVLNFHAGIEMDTIIDFIHNKTKKAEENLDGQVWCFFDEINTCDQLGLLSEVVCHQSCLGKPLPVNLVFLAACNPYSLRQGDTQTSGLTEKLVMDERSKLVYRVNPLPEALMDYVWDYGALDAKDEKAYTKRMIKGNIDDDLVPLFVHLLIMSQEFMKSTLKNNYSVSLRDVNRCKHLAHWMTKMLKDKKLAEVKHHNKCHQEYELRGIILALAHCYHSRLASADDRKLYREKISKIFKRRNHSEFSKRHIEEVIKCEQLDILNRMELEDGIAKNEALRENVFVVLISILNRIPVFLVGKPGSSKSLSMQLIRSNLRGPDSKDKYFKTLPAVYVVSYQGSESSTSEGIIKVFEKAKRYKEHNPDIIPVVLLDEIGLAENSSFNPLKVLHSLLEPSTGDFPEMAVVGISNWALDAAKMNRAVHISRPEPNADDLFETAKSIRDENAKRNRSKTSPKQIHEHDDQLLKKLAEAYHSHNQSQARKNFHGLRDYYSLIKSIALSSSQQDPAVSLEIGLLRNFGGNKKAMTGIMNSFMDTMDVKQKPDSRPTTIKLIEDNLEDRFARHLMLITSGDSALSIIEEVLSKMKKKYISLLGSRFDDDLSEEYNYRILSEIILCMEQGYILVLRDLENVYSSLYDMLNQNYTIVGKKRHCRVALGAYSNPMCQVNEDFRCIVVIDQQNVDYSDPPLLNRFEKQTLTFMDVVNDQQKTVIASLQKWVGDISTIPNMQFTPKQTLLGYHSDTIPSLVYSHCRDVEPDEEMEVDQFVQLCKNDLVKITPPDAVLRSSKSNCASDEVISFQHQYLKLPVNGGLRHYLELLLSNELKGTSMTAVVGDSLQGSSLKLIVYTFSSIHTDLRTCLADMPSFQVEKLSKFKSERQLSAALQRFNKSKDELFILQCKTSLDAKHMLLAKCLIDRWMAKYKREEMYGGVKHACIIVHVERDQNVKGMTSSFPWQFNFLCGWQQVTLDVLEKPKLQIEEMIEMSIEDICARTVDTGNVIKDKLLWCFSCIAYADQSKDVMEILELIRRITESPKLIDCFCRTVLQDIQKDGVVYESGIDKGAWQVSVACEHELLVECSSFNYALVEHVKRKIGQPLFKIVFFLERHNAWNSFFSQAQQKDIWKTMFCNPLIFDVRSHALPEPNGIESCPIHRTLPLLEFPFFSKLYDIIEKHLKSLKADAREKLIAESSYIYEAEMATKLKQVLHDRLPEAIKYDLAQHVDEEFLEEHLNLYLNDLCNVFSVGCVGQMSQEARVYATRLLVKLQDSALVKGLSTIEQLSYWHISLQMSSDLLSAELQLLHMYQVTTGMDCVQLLKVMTDSLKIQDENPCFDDENSIASEEYFDASEDLLFELDQVSETSSFGSTFESPYGDGSVKSDEAEETRDIPIKLTLVSHVCKSLLPTKPLLEHCTGQNIWARRINNILLLAASIDVRPQEHHYLHLCKDFVNLLVVPNNLPDDKLATLVELIADIDGNSLDSEKVLEFVQDIIQDVSNEDTAGSMQQLFLTKYFGYCLESNVDTPLLKDILKLLITEKGELIKGSRLVLFRVIRDEIEDIGHESVYTKVIREGVNPDDLSDNLVTLDEVLLELPSGENHHFAVLCCDLIEENGFHNLTALRLMSGGSSSHVVTAMTACRLLEKANKCSLQLVCALAFLNKLFRVFAEILIDNVKQFPETEEDFELLQHIRKVVDNSLKQSGREINVHLWILRYLFQQDSTNDLYKLMSSFNQETEFLKGIYSLTDVHSRSGIGLNPVSYMDLNGEITKALADFQEVRKKDRMRAVIDSLTSSPKKCVAFMAVLAEYYYCAGQTKDLTDPEWIVGEIEKEHLDKTPWCQLLKAVLGLSDFRGRMQLSKQVNISDVRLTSVLLHMAAVIVGNHSGQQMHNFLQFVCPSKQLQDLHFPGAATLSRRTNQHTRSVICKCSQLLVQSLGQDSHRVKCPTCGRKINWPVVPGAVEEEHETETGVGYMYPSVESWENLVQTGNISIKSRFIIDFLVHGCLFIASELSPPGSNIVDVCSAAELDMRLTKLWDTMPVVLRTGRQDTCVLLHCIIKEISPILTDTQYTFVSAANRDQQEIEIDKAVQKILSNSTHSMKRFLQDSFEALGTPVDRSLEHQLQELESIDGDTCKLLSRSVRQKRRPSLEDLKACFCDQSKNVERFPFLHLVLSQNNALKYVCNLPALLEWNKLVSARLSQQREKRKYADRPISSLIRAFPSMSVPWTAFRDAANNVCDGWTELTGETTNPDYITNDSEIIKCLMPTGKEQNTLKRMIKTLQNVQNKFLTKALEIAVTKECPAISFLIKENHLAALQTKPLDQVGKKDIITNPWNDQCLCYHDINTEYGHGTEITYELNQIEMEVALTTVVNKMILTDGCALEGFIFSDDLYHSSTAILEEIAAKVTQETLPKDIANLVNQSDRKNQGLFTNDLLQQLEVLMGLIKRTSGEPETTLQDYISKWSGILTIESPELFASIKLKHIVSLYQQFEVLLAAATVQTLGDKFRKKLPMISECELERCCSERPGDALIQIRDILKRFVFRYLRARHSFEPDCETRLRDLLKDMSGHVRVMPLLHKDLQLCHIVKLLEFVNKQIKEKEKPIKMKRKTTSKKGAHALSLY
ncbi:uncharacterized protein [Asterias amurensis]|uniref:uncharacterized protein n=1 Tax=Asterias amurensis TaxID=7602 RepID=UPI003AB3F3C1